MVCVIVSVFGVIINFFTSLFKHINSLCFAVALSDLDSAP